MSARLRLGLGIIALLIMSMKNPHKCQVFALATPSLRANGKDPGCAAQVYLRMLNNALYYFSEFIPTPIVLITIPSVDYTCATMDTMLRLLTDYAYLFVYVLF